MFFYKTRGPRNLPIDNPTLLSWNITDEGSKFQIKYIRISKLYNKYY